MTFLHILSFTAENTSSEILKQFAQIIRLTSDEVKGFNFKSHSEDQVFRKANKGYKLVFQICPQKKRAELNAAFIIKLYLINQYYTGLGNLIRKYPS